jgi:formiminotetrahydrofolate cyclodeaminase
MTYSSYALGDLLGAFAASEPVPGGGSAVALAGALGVSLLLMSAGLPKTRHGTPEEVADLAAAAARLRPLRDTLQELIDRDSAAYTQVMTSYRLPKGTAEEQESRRQAIRSAMRAATDTPLDTLRALQQALDGACIVAEKGAPAAATDVAVAIELLGAAARGAALNVDVNLPAVKDDAYVSRTREESSALRSAADAAVARARALLGS